MSEPAPEAGRLPAGYEFVKLLGHGANGWVALARQVQLDRLVAIKTIHAGIRDEDAAARLRREGRAIASLRHPNVVSVYELLISPDGVSLVMEHVPGGDLRHLLDDGRLGGGAAIRVLCDVAAALDHAHSRGIVHRDVKPANVLISPDGSAKLADFGLARLPRSTQEFRTMAGLATGTPLYMAPEQIEDPDLESPSIDAYAFAVLTYEVLTGTRPYLANEVIGMLNAHLFAAPISPWAVAPGLPGPVGEIVLAGLAKKAVDRASPARVADRLRAVAPADWDALFRGRPVTRSAPARSVSRTDGADEGERSGLPVPPSGAGTDAPARPLSAALEAGGWVRPAVYRPPATRRFGRDRVAWLVGVLGGLVVGVIVVLAVLHR